MQHLNVKAVRAAVLAVLVAIAVAPVGVAAADAPNDRASCVGQFSSFFAQGGGGTHRSDVAQGFAHDARPAGRNVYGHVAEGHASLDECFAMF